MKKYIADIIYEQLKNGAKVYIRKRPDVESVSVQVWFSVGSRYEDYKEKGMAHFLEHMLFNGSERYNYGELDVLVEGLGGQINAATSKDFTYYYINISSNYLRQAVDILESLTLRAKLEEDMIQKEKPIVIEELKRGMDSPINRFFERFDRLFYKVSNYMYPIIGYEETISNFNKEMLLDFYNSYYQPLNMTVSISGNVSEEDIKFIYDMFSQKPKNNIRPSIYVPEPPKKFPRKEVLEDPMIDRTYYAIGWDAPNIGEKMYYPFVVFDQILSGGKTSLIHNEIKEKGIVYSFSCQDGAHKQDNNYTIFAITDYDKVDTFKNKVFELLEKISHLKDEDIQKAKNKILNQEDFVLENPESEADLMGFSSAVVKDISYFKYFKSNIDNVDKNDILRLLDKYFKDDIYVELIMRPKNSL
ncbi:MAG: pitrilysin family protein [Hydrogenobaculum sp.]